MPPKPSCACGTCKRCKKREYMNRWYKAKTPEQRRAWVARRNPEVSRRKDRARRKTPEYQARQRVYEAIKRGKLERGPCEVGAGCSGPIEAHHEDYSRPLDVRWLCSTHHRTVHA